MLETQKQFERSCGALWLVLSFLALAAVWAARALLSFTLSPYCEPATSYVISLVMNQIEAPTQRFFGTCSSVTASAPAAGRGFEGTGRAP